MASRVVCLFWCMITLFVVPNHDTRAQVVRGQVVDSLTSAPIPSAIITLVEEDTASRDSTLADSEGLFQFRLDQPGRYQLQVRREGYRTSTFPRFQADLNHVRSFMLLVANLSPLDVQPSVTSAQLCGEDAGPSAEGAIYGVVTDGATGISVAEAEVIISWPDRISQLLGEGLVPDRLAVLTTDPSGRYIACGLPGQVWLTVYARVAGGLSDFEAVRFTENGVGLGDQRLGDQDALHHDLTVLPTNSHTAGLTGVITDVGTASPIAGAFVDIPALERRVHSDGQGRFTFANLPAGRLSVTLRSPGFGAIRREVLLRRNEVLQLPVDSTRLADAPLALEPIIVETEAATRRPLKDFWRRRDRGLGDFLTREEFERLGDPQTPVDVLRRMQGVRIQWNANYQNLLGNVNPRKSGIDERRWVVSSTRSGPRSIKYATYECPPLIFVDNLFMGDPWYVDVVSVVSLADVVAVEAYNGITNIPLELSRPGAECGAVVFWTR